MVRGVTTGALVELQEELGVAMQMRQMFQHALNVVCFIVRNEIIQPNWVWISLLQVLEQHEEDPGLILMTEPLK
jgi:hypothetical protein